MRFGILGDAKIAREKLVPALRKAGCDIVHLGRRDELALVSDDIWKGVKKWVACRVIAFVGSCEEFICQ